MTGVDIVGELLRACEPLVDLVPVVRIKAGALPDNIPLPALLLRTVTSLEHQTLKRGAVVRTVDRVAVTVRAANYRDQVAIIALLKSCCTGKTGDLAGALSVSILSAGTGPDVAGPANSFEQTQDFRVSFAAPA